MVVTRQGTNTDIVFEIPTNLKELRAILYIALIPIVRKICERIMLPKLLGSITLFSYRITFYGVLVMLSEEVIVFP